MQVVVQPDTATARLSVEGGEWTEATSRVSFSRWDATLGTDVPLPGGANIQALGGSAVYQDLEMPIGNFALSSGGYGTLVSYSATNEHGQTLRAQAVSLDVEWGLWLKSRKAPELTTRIEWEQVGDLISDTQGAVYEVYGGPGIGQFGGVAPEAFTLYGWVDGRIAYNRLRQLLQADRQVFLQTGEPKEFEDGWVQVTRVSFPNAENRLIETGSGMRYVRLECTRIDAPVGAAKGSLGAPYRLVFTGYDSYQALLDASKTYGDLLEAD